MTAVTVRAPVARAWSRVWAGRNRYLVGAVCLTICVFMLTPIVLSMLASVKTTAEAAAVPPTYIPHELSLDSYQRLWSYQAGLPTYLGNSFATAFMTIAFTLALTIPAGYALARFPVPGKELIFVFLLLALIIPYQALLTPIFLMFAQVKLTNTLVGLAIVHTAIQLPFSLYIMRNSFESVPRELEEAALTDGANSWQILTIDLHPGRRAGDRHGRAVRLRHVMERVPGGAGPVEPGLHVHPAADPGHRSSRDQPRWHRLGDAPGRHHDRDDPVHRHLPAAAEVLRLRVHVGRPEVTIGRRCPTAVTCWRIAHANVC